MLNELRTLLHTLEPITHTFCGLVTVMLFCICMGNNLLLNALLPLEIAWLVKSNLQMNGHVHAFIYCALGS